jgi:phage minor structural protein, N-terminal domain protein|nr:MAG TPA: Neck appendage protein [Caudoviricetes sp.]
MIYLFDKDERLIKLVKKDAIKTALQKFALTTEKYVSDRLTVEMKELSKKEFDAVEYMAIQSIEDAHTFHYFYIAQKFSGNLTTLIGVQSGIEELRKSVVLDKRPHNTFARPIINDLLAGTNWQARFVSETSQRSTNFYYISTFEALKKVCQVWNLEMQFFVEVNGNKIGARYIDFKQKIGEVTGKRVVYGHNALQILQEVERTNLFTALIGRGKGEEISAPTDENNTSSYGRRITFEDVVWEVKKGNPVDKPKGQKYVELPEMTKRYGIKNADGSMRAKVGFAVFEDEEDKNALIKRTYDELVSASRPQLTLKTSTVYLKGVKIGDTIRVVRHDKKLDYDTRIFEITFNRLNDQSSDIKLGDRIGESNEAKAQTIAAKVVDDFVSNEFSNFVQNLPDFLPSPDGFNNNWYGAEDPTVKYPGKVLINDIWFKPDPEHEGYKIMLRWTGEVWDEILRSYDKESLKKQISEEITNFDKAFQSVNEQNKKKIDEILQSSGASSLLAQEAKRIGLDSVAKLEEFKRQATSAQTALSGDLDVLKRTIANDIRPKQAQAEAEIAKQVEALVQTKKELAGVKSAQATYEETTTRSLAELTNLANGKASKSELTQTAEELSSKIASVQAGSSRNYFRNSRSRTFTTGDQAVYDYRTFIVPDFWKNSDRFKRNYVRISFDVAFPIALARDTQANVHFSASPWYGYKLTFKGGTTERQHFEFTIDLSSSSETYQTDNVFIRFGTNYGFPAGLQVVIENAMLSVGNYFPAYQPAYEDQEDRVSVVESNFKQRADALDAGVNRLTEGLRSKADISSLNVTAENIRQSVKSLETSTQNKLNKMLSLAEFEVRAGSIRQEILNATKDKADKTLVTTEAGKLREEFASLRIGGRNLLKGSKGPFKPDKNPANFDNQVLYHNETSIHLVQNEKYRISAKTDGIFDSQHNSSKESDNVVLWLMDKAVTQYQIVSDAKTGTTGTEFVWSRPTGTYHLLVNTYRKDPEKLKSVWEVKVEQGSFKTDWSPAPEDAEGLITEAKATFERTAQGLRTDLSAIQEYVNKDGQRQESLQRYTREESAKQATAVRELVSRDFVAKSTFTENVEGIRQRFEALTRDNETKLAEFRQGIDGRIADITSQVAGKVNNVDFQHVRETAKLHERILGTSETGAPDKLSRLVMSSEIFQTEVGKYSTQGGPNMLRNSRADDGLKYWTEADGRLGFTAHSFYFNGQKRMFELRPGAIVKSPRFIVKRSADYTLNILGFDNNSKYFRVYFCKRKKGSNADFEEKQLVFIGRPQWTDGPVFSNKKAVKKSFKFNIGDFDDGYLQFEYDRNNPNKWGGLFMTELDFYEGSNDRLWQPAPEDSAEPIEATRTQVTQLAGSYAIKNLNSAGDLVSGLNLGANGHNRLDGKLTHITGETLIDRAVIKSAMIAEAQINTAHIDSIDATNGRIINLSANNFTANRVEGLNLIGGDLTATNGAMKINLNKGQYEVYTEEAAMRRVVAGFPNQFIKFATGKQEVEHEEGVKSGVTVIGSNSDGSEDGNNQTFAGIQIWNNAHQRNVNSIGDYMRVSNKGFGENEKGWVIQTSGTPSIAPIAADGKPETGKRSAILSGDFYFINKWGQSVSLLGILERFIVNFNTLRDKRGMLHTDFPELN